MKCKNCVNLVEDWCDMKTDSPDPDMERECHWFAQKTNADNLRAMTDEELAEFINKLAPANGWAWWLDGKSWFDWMKQEAADA